MEKSIGEEKTVAGKESRAELAPGDRLGRYRVIKLLGRGGMGQVYLVRHELQESLHALKILPHEFSYRSGFVERFRTELKTMARLHHENVVHVQYSDEENGLYYLVMDFIAADGTDEPYDLEEALAEHKQFDPDVVRMLMLQICDGLEHAHSNGVIHRDLKPSNILLERDTGYGMQDTGGKDLASRTLHLESTASWRAKITDFGLAKVVGEEQLRTMVAQSIQRSMSLGDESTFVEKKRSERSSTGSVLGTYGYMSPEQEEGRSADERSDIYALGVMMYRMITGQRLRGMAKSPSKLVPGLDPSWDTVIEKCLEQNPDERFQSVSELRSQLSEIGDQKSGGESFARKKDAKEQWPQKTQNLSRQRREGAKKWVVGLLVVGLLGAGGFGVYKGWTGRRAIRPQQEEQSAEMQLSRDAEQAKAKLETDCEDAKTQREKMETARKAAESAKASILAMKEWEMAVGTDRRAVLAFEEGNFTEASRHWKTAVDFFQTSEKLANKEADLQAAEARLAEQQRRTDELQQQKKAEEVARLAALKKVDQLNEKEDFNLSLGGGEAIPLKWIPKGSFMMGSTAEQREWAADENGGKGEASYYTDETDPKRVSIRNGFWLGQTEVTVGQWKQFIEDTRHKTDAEERGEAWCFSKEEKKWMYMKGKSWRDPNWLGVSLRDDHPVACISWNDAKAFCEWLNKTHGDKLPEGYAFRLPGEAEWEYAARGGREGTKFWWGDWLEDGKGRFNGSGDDDIGMGTSRWSGNYSWSDGFGWASSVDAFGVKGRNGFGLADMMGNVWEWCEDWYDEKGPHATINRATASFKVLRGGSFFSQPGDLRCARRGWNSPTIPSANFGFRVCVGISSP